MTITVTIPDNEIEKAMMLLKGIFPTAQAIAPVLERKLIPRNEAAKELQMHPQTVTERYKRRELDGEYKGRRLFIWNDFKAPTK